MEVISSLNLLEEGTNKTNSICKNIYSQWGKFMDNNYTDTFGTSLFFSVLHTTPYTDNTSELFTKSDLEIISYVLPPNIIIIFTEALHGKKR